MKVERVFVVDYELLSPIAFGKNQINEGLKTNKKGESLVNGFDTSGLPFKVGAEVKEDISSLLKNEPLELIEACRYDRKLELLVACYQLGKDRFEKLTQELAPSRGGVVLGLGSDVTKFEMFEDQLMDIFKMGDEPYKDLILRTNTKIGMVNSIWNASDIHTIYIAEKMNLAAFQKTILTACTSSTQAIAFGYDAIRNGSCDLVVTGGTDSIINALALSSFGKLGVIVESDGSNMPTCTPFDSNRKGTLAGEAAGLVVIVNEQYLNDNKLTPMAEILSYGNTLDGYKITAPDPSGESMEMAMRTALERADIKPEEVDYILAHGTATRHNDTIELDAIKSVFGDAATSIPISSTKDRHGHAIAAAGVQELSVLLSCMEHDFLPSNMNMKNSLDDKMNLLRTNQERSIKYAMTNNFAFGGVNTVIILKNLK